MCISKDRPAYMGDTHQLGLQSNLYYSHMMNSLEPQIPGCEPQRSHAKSIKNKQEVDVDRGLIEAIRNSTFTITLIRLTGELALRHLKGRVGTKFHSVQTSYLKTRLALNLRTFPFCA